MKALDHNEVLMLFISLGLLLGLARALGELFRAWRQPPVVGEILAGVILGPSILGMIAPGFQSSLFPLDDSGLASALEGLSTLAIALFLLVAGLEVDLSVVFKQGKAALGVGIVGMVVPFGLGFALASSAPGFLGNENTNPLVFNLFFATALSISALPVVAKILMDIGIYRSDLGMVMVAAAIFNDIVGWIIFAMILGMMGTAKVMALPLGVVIALTLLFAGGMLTVGRWLAGKAVPWLQAHTSWPGGVLGFIAVGTFFSAAITEWIGVHAIFGAFLFGVAVGDSPHLKERTRATLEQFVSFIFVPLFFAGIGLKVNFVTNFDLALVVVVFVIATIGKVVGCYVGASWCGMGRRESLAIGFGLNARGAMEIILGLLALQAGVIGERLFVALVIMAVGTSMLSGTLIEKALQRRKPHRIANYLKAKQFNGAVKAETRETAIAELSTLLAEPAGIPAEEIARSVLARELIIPTGIGNGVAIPHGRIEGLKAPLVALGRSEHGIDFDARDGRPAHLIYMILVPVKDGGAQLELLADIARASQSQAAVAEMLSANGLTELLAHMRSRQEEH